MWRCLLCVLACLFTASACCLPAFAQREIPDLPPTGSSTPTPAPTATPTDTNSEKPERTPALQTAAAALYTVLIMLLICMPSRKG